ncbi:integrase [Kitasatospora sp. MAA19]|uniref:hypothetical protein n=1 Tax=unclassified Kitasatospora TaxID=2633591 RepID=UPI002473605C|nr:hypothetical protein [Kitasatospora sp. MAA19]MDH6710751.1 integrase [Kitasatospora sp. MAA19]
MRDNEPESTSELDTDGRHRAAREELPVLVDLAIAEGVSKAVENGLRWIEGTLKLALDDDDFRMRYGRSLRDLLGPGAAELLRLTAQGELRKAELQTPTKGVLASQRRRATMLRRLAATAGVPCGAPSFSKPTLKDSLPSWARSAFHDRLDTLVQRRPTDHQRARILAIIGVVLDTAARAGELCSQDLDDLSPDLSWTRIRRNPQAQIATEAITEVWALSPTSRAAVGHYLPLRQDLVRGMEGSADALWVSLRANHNGGTAAAGNRGARRPGMRLETHGLATTYRKQIQLMKDDLTARGGKGWEIPVRMEQLRRGVQERARRRAQDHPDAPKRDRWAPVLVLGPTPDGKRTAQAFADVARAVDAFHTARPKADGDDTEPAVQRARKDLTEATRQAWATGPGHILVLTVLHQAGLAPTDLAAAGYDGRLLAALGV